MTAPTPKLGELVISICEIPGHAPHAARITVDYGLQVTSFCLPPERAEFLGDALPSKARERVRTELAAVSTGLERYQALVRGVRRELLRGGQNAADARRAALRVLADAGVPMEPDGPLETAGTEDGR